MEIATMAAIASLLPTPLHRLPLATGGRDFERSLAITHTMRAALAVLLSLSAASGIGIAFYYWAPIPALIVLKPVFTTPGLAAGRDCWAPQAAARWLHYGLAALRWGTSA